MSAAGHDHVPRRRSRRRAAACAPRTSTSGRPLVLPEASSAADAISSATATTVACIVRPAASGSAALVVEGPRSRPRPGRRPRCPSATVARTSRLTMTADADAQLRADARRGSPRAEASGVERQQGHLVASPDVGGVHAGVGAHEARGWVREMITPCSMRRTSTDSRSTTSTWRGSRSQRSANATASGRGSTVPRSTMRPSALDTTFWVTTSTSPARGARSGSLGDELAPRRRR